MLLLTKTHTVEVNQFLPPYIYQLFKWMQGTQPVHQLVVIQGERFDAFRRARSAKRLC